MDQKFVDRDHRDFWKQCEADIGELAANCPLDEQLELHVDGFSLIHAFATAHMDLEFEARPLNHMESCPSPLSPLPSPFVRIYKYMCVGVCVCVCVHFGTEYLTCLA